MSIARSIRLSDLIADISAGVSLPGENRVPTLGEVGILTLSALSGTHLDANACKAISGDLVPKLGPCVRAGTILISRSNTPELVGSCVYVEADVPDRYLPDLIWEVSIRPDGPCDGRWLTEYLRSSQGRRNLLRAAAGTSGSMIKLSMDRLRRLKVVVPAIDVQQAIVRSGSHLDRTAATLSSLVDAKRRFKRGLMQQVLTGRKRFPEFCRRPRNLVQIADIANLVTARIDPRKPSEVLRCVELEHIESETGRLIGETTTATSESIKTLFAKSDVLFGKLRPYLRKFLRPGFQGACSTEIWALRPDQSKVSTEFLFHLLDSSAFRRSANAVAGSKMPRADWNVVSETMVWLPELDEQERITGLLDAQIREIDLLIAQREQIHTYKRALLSRLFNGELAVYSQ